MADIEVYDRVRVVTPRFESQGVQAGMQGYVIDKYPDGNMEVEISNPATGETIAFFAATPSDLERDE
jgi:hypothetical protein